MAVAALESQSESESESESQSQLQLQSELELESFNNKTIYICFTGSFYKGYAVRSLPLNSLFNHHETPPPPLKEVWSFMENSAITREGVGILGSNVYFVGGVHHEFEYDYNPGLLLNPNSNSNSSKYVVCCNIANGSTSFVPNMISPKPDPIVFTVGESLYVIADPSDVNIPDPAFEVCNLSTKSKLWEELEAPPFLNLESKYCDISFCERLGYVVIGKSICVSTSKSSFKFDTKKKIWEPCMLFDGVSSLDTDSEQTRCGPPFGFYGQAVLFGNDTLICMHQPIDGGHVVVAYKMVGGKVVQSQSFSALTVPNVTYNSCIHHIGDGFFCVVVIECNCFTDLNYVLNVKLFHLIKKKEDDDHKKEFLLCEVVNEFKYNYKMYEDLDLLVWQPISCFVQ